MFQTLYSVYVQINPREVPSEGGIVSVRAEVRRASSPACIEIATPTSTVAQVFNARGKIGQALGAFALPLAGATSDSSGYMSLLCIDARMGAPTVTSRSVRTTRAFLLVRIFFTPCAWTRRGCRPHRRLTALSK